jgi:pimeloyl-ACP methyl ester carboxylesterase
MIIECEGGRTFINTGGRPLDPKKPSLLFIHGSGLDQSVWALQNRFFAHHGFNSLAVDLPGHGRSERPRKINRIEEYGNFVAALVEALQLTEVVLVGHSMGSLIVLDAAARSSPSKVILMGAADAIPVHPDLLEAAKERPGDAAAFMATTGFGPRGHRGPSAVPGANLMTTGQRLFDHGKDDLLFDDLTACEHYRSGLEAAARITCPVLLILGELDRMTPLRRGRALSAAMPDAETHILPGTGHMVMLEEPAMVKKLMTGFLAGQKVPG